MSALSEQIAQAKAAGYSDSDIAAHLSSKPEMATKIKTATDAGYKPEEIIANLSSSVKTAPTAGQIANALPAGVNRGMVNMAGLPVDTMANVVDLGKAGAGYLASKVKGALGMGDTVPEALEVNPDRSNMIGSSQWLDRKMHDAGLGVTIDNPAPDSTTARLLHAGGQFAGQAAVMPAQGMRQAISNVAQSVPVGALAQGVTEATDNPLAGAMAGMVAPSAVRGIGNASAGKLDSMSRSLMQSALKPTIAELRKGNVDPAIQTLLENGINVTRGGVDQLRGKIGGLNEDIASRIANSDATVSRENVLSALSDTRQRFTNQVSPAADLSAIGKVADDFSNHPYFANVEAQCVPLLNALATATKGKTQALQAAGKLETFAQQQNALAGGSPIRLAPIQPENQLYFNAGITGGEALSPSAYPVLGQPK